MVIARFQIVVGSRMMSSPGRAAAASSAVALGRRTASRPLAAATRQAPSATTPAVRPLRPMRRLLAIAARESLAPLDAAVTPTVLVRGQRPDPAASPGEVRSHLRADPGGQVVELAG